MLTDTHARLDYSDLAVEFEGTLPRATDAGVTRMITNSQAMIGVRCWREDNLVRFSPG
jgi:hypothetical protein